MKTTGDEQAALNPIRGWKPPRVPHCSDCSNCRVTGHPDQPLVYCAAGHDREQAVDLWRMIRPFSPRGFRSARTCPDFASMADEPEAS